MCADEAMNIKSISTLVTLNRFTNVSFFLERDMADGGQFGVPRARKRRFAGSGVVPPDGRERGI